MNTIGSYTNILRVTRIRTRIRAGCTRQNPIRCYPIRRNPADKNPQIGRFGISVPGLSSTYLIFGGQLTVAAPQFRSCAKTLGNINVFKNAILRKTAPRVSEWFETDEFSSYKLFCLSAWQLARTPASLMIFFAMCSSSMTR